MYFNLLFNAELYTGNSSVFLFWSGYVPLYQHPILDQQTITTYPSPPSRGKAPTSVCALSPEEWQNDGRGRI